MKKRIFIFVLICILLLISSCANGGDAPSTDAAVTTARLEDYLGGRIRRPDSVICETEEEYLSFLKLAEQMNLPPFLKLDAFEGFGDFEQFWIDEYEDGQYDGFYRFDCNGVDLFVSFCISENDDYDRWTYYADPELTPIQKEDLPEELVVDIHAYWIDQFREKLNHGTISKDAVTPELEAKECYKGSYYHVTDRVTVGYAGEYLSDVEIYSPSTHSSPTVYVELEQYRFWIFPFAPGLGKEEEYARVKEKSDLMDRLLTKSTCEEAAKELYEQFVTNLETSK